MNKHISRLLHSALMVGALLPISPLAPLQLSPLQPHLMPTRSFTQISGVNNSLPTHQQAYQPDVPIVDGRGLPKFRDGGGTR